jgi:hypothetical protein
MLPDELRRLLRAVIIHSPLDYELDGRRHRVAPFGAGRSQTWSAHSTGQPPLVSDLEMRIYEAAYCRPLGSLTEPPETSVSMLEELSAANAGRDRWETGWSLQQLLHSGYATARKGELSGTFGPGEFNASAGGAPSPGSPLQVLFARESRTQQPGFYVANGETPAPSGADTRMTRIYWHIAQEGAAALTAALTTSLNRYQVPFRFKTLSYSGAYSRSDAAVLYFAARYYQIVTRLLPAIIDSVKQHLRPATPLLTSRIADGVALAEDPATGESFGMSRSRLVAQAIWDAYARGMQTEEARLMELSIQFERNGLSLERPHLRGASADIYTSTA